MAAPMKMCFRNLLGFSSKLQFSRPGRYCKISRDYAKFIRRKPVRVVTPIESKPELEPVVKDDFVQKSAKKVVTSQITNKKIGEWKDGEYVGFRTIDSKVHGELKYTKLEEHDKRFGPAIMATKSGRYREKQGVILLEGARLISDAIKGGAQLKQLYFSMPELLEKIPLTKRMKKSLKLYKVQYKHLNVWSDVVTPSGILGIFDLPSPGECVRREEFIVPITVICDNIRDPGNMGTLIRSCAAAGCEKLIATKGCVDVWEPKVLRSAVGAHFRLPIIPNVQHDMVSNYLDQTGQIFIADNRCNTEVSNKLSSSHSKHNDDDTMDDTVTIENVNDPSKPVLDYEYTELIYPNKGTAILIGGETVGISEQMRDLINKSDVSRVKIPMMPGIDSLNAAVAGTLVIFEARRQILQAMDEEWTGTENQGITEYTQH